MNWRGLALFVLTLLLEAQASAGSVERWEKAFGKNFNVKTACRSFSRLQKTAPSDDHYGLVSLKLASLQCPSPVDHQRLPDWTVNSYWLQLAKWQTSEILAQQILMENSSFSGMSSTNRVDLLEKLNKVLPSSSTHKSSISTLLYEQAPGLAPKESQTATQKTIDDLIRRRRWPEARRLIYKRLSLSNLSAVEQLKTLKSLFSSHKLNKFSEHKQMVATAKRLQRTSQKFFRQKKISQERNFQTQMSHVRFLWSYVDTKEALGQLHQLRASKRSKKGQMEQWLLLKARLLEQYRSPKKARQFLAPFLKTRMKRRRTKNHESLASLFWYYGWLCYQTKGFPLAEKVFQRALKEKSLNPHARFKFLYWLSQSQEKSGQSKLAKLTQKTLEQEDAFGYYGILVRDANTSLPPLESEEFKSPQSFSPSIQSFLRLLTELNDRTALEAYLQTQFQQALPLEKPIEKPIELLSWYQLLNQYQLTKFVFRHFYQLKYETQRELFQRAPRLFFPKPFEKNVLKASQHTGISPLWIWSIMRQESAYDPMARSHMDAFGLLQLLPKDIDKLAKKLPPLPKGDLYHPERNIFLGAQLLKDKWEEFDQNMIYASAAYNSTSNKVKQWRERYDKGLIDEFIDSIPYSETKTYAKLVYRNWVFYNQLQQK